VKRERINILTPGFSPLNPLHPSGLRRRGIFRYCGYRQEVHPVFAGCRFCRVISLYPRITIYPGMPKCPRIPICPGMTECPRMAESRAVTVLGSRESGCRAENDMKLSFADFGGTLRTLRLRKENLSIRFAKDNFILFAV